MEKMATQREQDAADYLKKHKIPELLENLTSMLFFYRPGQKKPREFLVEQLELLKISQQSNINGPSLFNKANLDAVFGILDPANQKHITFAQYKQGEHVIWTVYYRRRHRLWSRFWSRLWSRFWSRLWSSHG
uniref:Si:dkey-42p14.3 n=1 Tax=Cyclopterus lumpus TaxID=8103 RepID=A0A8C3APD3_CYCLU